MKLTFRAKTLIMILVMIMTVIIYIHLISWRASMNVNYNMMPGGEIFLPLIALFLINI